METPIGCETCIHGYLSIDKAGYYCSQPEFEKIECVKAKLAHYVAQLNELSNASSNPAMENVSEREASKKV